MAFKKKKAKRENSMLSFTQKPNSEIFMEELRVLSSASVGVVLIRTKEFHRAVEFIFEFAVSKGNTAFGVWTVTEGWKEISTTPRVSEPAAFNVSDPSIIPPALGSSDFGRPQRMRAEDEEWNTPVPANQEPESAEFIFDLYPQGVEGDKAVSIDKAMKALFSKFSDAEQASINVMISPDQWLNTPAVQEYIRAFNSKSLDTDNRVVLICHDTVEIPETLFEEIKIIDFPVPNATELYEYCNETLDGLDFDELEVDLKITEADKRRIVQNALGMSRNEFTTALSVGIVKQDEPLKEGEPLDVDKLVENVLSTKTEALKKTQILEIMKPVNINKVGGLDLLKSWLNLRKKAFSPEAREYGIRPPKGILCAGIPGSGKSLIAKATAHVLQIPAFSLDIGKVFGSLVGQSEGQMRAALKMVEAMAPCVLMLDEIDKGFSNTSGGGDSGTSSRVFGTFLTWMQERDSNKPVFVVMTANNVDHLPPELLRSGRLDEKFAVSFPMKEDRKAIFKIHLEQRGHELSDADIEMAADATPQFVGAEIEGVVEEALLISFDRGLKAPTGKVLVEVAQNVKPLAKVFPEKIKRMNEWAKNNARPASSDFRFDSDAVRPKTIGSSVKRRSRRVIKPGRHSTDD